MPGAPWMQGSASPAKERQMQIKTSSYSLVMPESTELLPQLREGPLHPPSLIPSLGGAGLDSTGFKACFESKCS